MSAVLFDVSDSVAALTLNRPDRLNAINRDLLLEFEAALEDATANPHVRVVTLTGAGTAFSAGDDLHELRDAPPQDGEVEEFIGRLQNITRLMMLGPKTVVCAVRGWAIGGGGAWPLNADLAVWSESARLRFPEARHGLFPSGGATLLLERFCGPHRAQEILLTGETLGLPQLRADGIVSHAAPNDTLENETTRLVEGLLSLPKDSLARYKAARARALEVELERALEVEQRGMTEAIRAVLASGVVPEIKPA